MQTITVTCYHAGNLAMESDCFSIPYEVAKVLRNYLKKEDPWHYDYFRINKLIYRAQRANKGNVRIYTGGFASGHLSNAIYCAMPEGSVEVVMIFDADTDQRK